MISIIIPFHNEEQNLALLYKEITTSLSKVKQEYEILFIDDGSTDGGCRIIKDIKSKDDKVISINHKTRMGKGKALLSGVNESKGHILVFMDADLQDNPKYISDFVEKIKSGYDLVNGVRIGRKENFIIKAYTKTANYLLKLLLKSPFIDINCGYKALSKKILDEIILYGNNFRFLPLASHYAGFNVAELNVEHRPRQFGKSKYGIKKIFIGMTDFLTAAFLYKFSEKPLHFFGLFGGFFFTLGFFIAVYLSIERIFFGVLLYRRPILFLAILLIIVGIQIIMTGIIGELIVYVHKKTKYPQPK